MADATWNAILAEKVASSNSVWCTFTLLGRPFMSSCWGSNVYLARLILHILLLLLLCVTMCFSQNQLQRPWIPSQKWPDISFASSPAASLSNSRLPIPPASSNCQSSSSQLSIQPQVAGWPFFGTKLRAKRAKELLSTPPVFRLSRFMDGYDWPFP